MQIVKIPEKQILEGDILKVIFALGWPVIVSSLLQIGYNMADTFWLGRWGNANNAMSAVAAMQIAWPLIFVMISLSIGFAIAGISIVSQYTGAKKVAKASEATGQLLSLGIVLGVFIGLIGILITPYLIQIMHLDADVAKYAYQYMVIIFLGLPFMFITSIFMSVLRAYGDSITPMKVSAIGVGLNIILDPFLINGYYGFPELGVIGAAIATVFTRGIATGISLWILFKGVGNLKVKLEYFKLKLHFVKKIFRIGLPASMGQFSSAIGIFILMWIIASLPNSTIALAAYGVGERIIDIGFIIVDGIGVGMATVIGHSLGAKKYDRAGATFKEALKLTFLILAIETFIIIIFRYQLVAFFIPHSPEVIEEGALFLLIFGIGIPFFGIISSVEGLYEGAGNTKPIMVIDIVRLWGFRVLFSYILGIMLGLGSTGVWIGMAISNVATAILSLGFYLTGSWKMRVIE